MNATGISRNLSSAFGALKDLLALVGVAAIGAHVLLPLREPIERALPAALPTLPALVMDQVVAATPSPAPVQEVADTPLQREQQAGADVVAQYDGTKHPLAGKTVAFADRKRGGHDARSGMGERRRMGIVGFVSVTGHAVGKRGVRGGGHDARAHDTGFRLAAQGADVTDAGLSGKQPRARDHGGKSIHEMNLCPLGNCTGQRFSCRRGDVAAQFQRL